MASVFPSFEDLPASIPALVLEAAERHGQRPALEDGERRISYAELPEHMLRVTRALLAAGITQGDRVVIWAPNSIDWVVLAIGLQAAGAVLVPLNTRMKGSEAADIVARSGARLAFVQGSFLGSDYQAALNQHRPETLERMVLIGAEPQRPDDQSLQQFLSGAEQVSLEQALNCARAIGPDDLSDLLFT